MTTNPRTNLLIERAILGRVLLGEAFPSELPAESFTLPEHISLWRALEQKRPETALPLLMAYCTSLTSEAYSEYLEAGHGVSAQLFQQYIEYQRESHAIRQLHRACKYVLGGAEASATYYELLTGFERHLIDAEPGARALNLGGQTGALEARLSQQRDPHHTQGALTHYRELDAILGGLRRGSLTILAGRPGMGKTALALQICLNQTLATASSSSLLFFSLEMTTDELMMRVCSNLSGINLSQYQAGYGPRDSTDRLLGALERLKGRNFWVDDNGESTLARIRGESLRLKRELGTLTMIVIDYLQLVRPEDSKAPREQQVAAVSRGLKALAKQINSPILVLAQLNRASDQEDRIPRLSDLRESGSIEQDADAVIFLDRDREAAPISANHRNIRLHIGKNRHGELRSYPMIFEPGVLRFSEASQA